MDILHDEEFNFLDRSHCPTAMARLLDGMEEQDAELYAAWRKKVVDDLLGRISKRSKDQNEIQQSSILALGLIGTNAAEDAAIRKAIEEVPAELSDQQSKNFSTIAMAKVGASGTQGYEDGVEQAGKFLLKHLDGKSNIRPWAGLAIGVMGAKAQEEGINHEILAELGSALRTSLKEEKGMQRLAAYAIGTGIMGDLESSEILQDYLKKVKDFEALGYVAVALGLMNERNAIEPIQEIIDESKYRPELLKQAAIALGLLGDKELVDKLIEMLQTSKGLATQAAISSALGFIGDQRSIDPLVEMLRNKDLTDRARGFAAVALGIVADKEELPWNTKIAVDLNYRASVSTLVDPNGTGILDIL